jgi:hypothetical protein
LGCSESAGAQAEATDSYAIQEIPARDVAVHAKLAIARSITVFVYEVSDFFYTPFTCS